VSTPDRVGTDTSSDIDPCPYCGATSGVQPTAGTSPKVQAWSCTACGTQWAISVVNPRPYFDRLAAAVELAAARSMLRQVIALVDQAPGLTDAQLRTRLVVLAGLVR
jgi:transposase-like protein